MFIFAWCFKDLLAIFSYLQFTFPIILHVMVFLTILLLQFHSIFDFYQFHLISIHVLHNVDLCYVYQYLGKREFLDVFHMAILTF